MADGDSEKVGFLLSNNNNNNNNNNINNKLTHGECSSKDAASTDQLIAENFDIKKNNDAATIFRCEKCEKFETKSHPAFLVHTIHCLTSASTTTTTITTTPKQEANDTNSNGPIIAATTTTTTTENEKPRKLFECDVCNMKFSNGANMRRHKMRHTGVKPYECRVCQKRFFRKDHLAEHFTTHTKTLPYHCPICNRGFQRQIAMRAHFQNEHVGQHDLVKTCPLCSYRAGTMKSLRVHFFNRHGIDLDNPGSAAPTSLLLALNSQSSEQFQQTLNITQTSAITPSYSDSGDSLRSTDNATPPMHFLTPHVEISMAENHDQPNIEMKSIKSDENNKQSNVDNDSLFTSRLTSSSPKLSVLGKNTQNNSNAEGHITPSISLIPIKQEPTVNEEFTENKTTNLLTVISNFPETNNSTTVTNQTSLIKVSPLKSLLREDLKRRICARANNRAARNLQNGNNNNNNNGLSTTIDTVSNNNCTPIINGNYSASSNEIDLSPSNRKTILQCLFCRIEFPDQTLYFLHKGCHSDSNPWKCNICGEQCNNVYEFNSHLLSKSHQ